MTALEASNSATVAEKFFFAEVREETPLTPELHIVVVHQLTSRSQLNFLENILKLNAGINLVACFATALHGRLAVHVGGVLLVARLRAQRVAPLAVLPLAAAAADDEGDAQREEEAAAD